MTAIGLPTAAVAAVLESLASGAVETELAAALPEAFPAPEFTAAALHDPYWRVGREGLAPERSDDHLASIAVRSSPPQLTRDRPPAKATKRHE
jgi:hypothetical protein